VFNLWIDHGPKPSGARYAYAVLPDVTVEDVQSFSDAPPVTVLAQTPSLQAVASADGSKVQAVFFEPGRLAWGDGQAIEADAPCLVTLDKTAAPARLHVADPTHRQEAIKVRLSGRYHRSGAQYNADKDWTGLTIDLPLDGFAGRSMAVQLRP